MGVRFLSRVVFWVVLLAPHWANAGPDDIAKLRKALSTHILPCDKADFPSQLTHADIVAAFGASAVSSVTMHGAEGEGPSWQETILFPKVPDDSIQIAWQSKTWTSDRQGKGVASLLVKVDAADEKARARGLKWRGPGGLHIGSTISEIETVNGKPFTFSGLEWHYDGVHGWNGGLLDGKPGSCSVNIVFLDNPKVPKAATDEILGEHTFQSSDPVLRAAAPIAMSLQVSPVR